MHVHLVGTAPPWFPSHLATDLRRVLEQSGHRVSGHLLGELPLSEAADAGALLAGRIGGRPALPRVVIHALDETAAVVALHARSSTGVPVVMRAEHSHEDATPRRRLVRQACLRVADALTTPSEPDLRAVLAAGARADRTTVVPDTVAMAASRQATTPAAPGRRVVCLTGAGSAGELVAALRWAPRAELVVAGSSTPDQRHRLHAEAERLDLSDRVSSHGWLPRDRAMELAATADVIAVPGRPGIRATTAIEAMGLGVPVVAVGVPVLADAVVHGTTGLITPPGNPPALGAALRRLLDDPFQREAFGEAALDRFAARYASDVVVAAVERVYDLLEGIDGQADLDQPALLEAV